MKNMILEQNARSDNAMALVHDQQQAQEAILKQQRADTAASQKQMQEVLEAIQHLSDLINDDNKGEKEAKVKGKGKGKKEESTSDAKLSNLRGR